VFGPLFAIEVQAFFRRRGEKVIRIVLVIAMVIMAIKLLVSF